MSFGLTNAQTMFMIIIGGVLQTYSSMLIAILNNILVDVEVIFARAHKAFQGSVWIATKK